MPADQFNHSVAAWRDSAGGFVLLDPTWAPLSRLNWSNAEAQQHYVVGTPSGDELRETAKARSSDNLLDVEVEWEFEDSGESEGLVRIKGTGYMETALRRRFGFAPGHEWKRLGEELVKGIRPQARLVEFPLRRTDVEDLDKPFAIELEFAATTTAPGSGPLVVRPASFNLFANGRALWQSSIEM